MEENNGNSNVVGEKKKKYLGITLVDLIIMISFIIVITSVITCVIIKFVFTELYNDDCLDEWEYYEEEPMSEEEKLYECKWATEAALQYLYSLGSNPLYTILNELEAYEAVKTTTLQPDGTYNIKMSSGDLLDILEYSGIDDSLLETNEILKNNINIVSEQEINLKDTGSEKEISALVLDFKPVEVNKFENFEGYACIEEYEYDENTEEDNVNYKYFKIDASLNSEANISYLNYVEIPKESLSEEAAEELEEYYSYDEEEFEE